MVIDPITVSQTAFSLTNQQWSLLIMGAVSSFSYLFSMCLMANRPAKYVWIGFTVSIISVIVLYFAIPVIL